MSKAEEYDKLKRKWEQIQDEEQAVLEDMYRVWGSMSNEERAAYRIRRSSVK